ncbi:MAG: hypothetical protein IKA75_03400 [Bacteroidaceae bacterium]|nr:hypothetical protein [Bacteroidaceae bacterium]
MKKIKKTNCLITLFILLMQGCTHDYIENDIYFSNVNKSTGIELPNDIEDFGKAVALGIKTTIYNMIEQGVDYSEIPDSINFRKSFFADWYAANPKINETRSTEMNFPYRMSASEFAERYKMLTTIQVEYIHKIIKECKLSSSSIDLLNRLVILRNDICLYVPEFEQERLLYVISVLYYGIKMILELEAEGLMLNTPYNYHKLQLSNIKTRAEMGSIATVVPEGCRSFLATVWTIAVGEPTPLGDIVAIVSTIYVGGVMVYEIIACTKEQSEEEENLEYCTNKYIECTDTKPDWAKEHSGGFGYSICNRCLEYCINQKYWQCPVP